MKIRALMAAAALATLAASPAFANLLINGDFDTPATPPGGVLFYGGGGSFLGWNVTGPSNNGVVALDTAYAELSALFEAESGNVSLDITGSGNAGSTAGVNQTVATVAGTTYDLSFWVGNQDGSGNGGYVLPSTVDVLINGNSVGAFTNSDTSHFMINWKQFSLSFTATETSTNIAFLNGTDQGDNEAGLDNVVLTEHQAGVPEPAAWALMITGFGLAGAGVRRRRALLQA